MNRRYSKIQTCGVLLLSALLVTGANLSVRAQTAVSAAQPATPSAAATTAAPASATAPTASAAPAPAASDIVSMAAPPRAEMIHRTLYAIYDKQDNHDLAMAELDELIRLKPSDAVFPFAYGNVLMKDQKWPDAIARFQAATKLDPTFSNAYCGMGDCQMKLKKFSDAIDSYTLASRNAKAGQNFTSKVAIARQYQERKQQEDDYNAAVKKLSAPKSAPKAGAKKKT
jgi:tetratricopeptide (TPR) repeat protein